MEKPILSQYVDYRKFLADYYAHRVEETSHQLRPYSYSDFSAAANIKSPNYLKLIIEGKRNLSKEMCGKFARALKLTRSETSEFELLVSYCQEKDPLQRNRCLKELSEFRAKKSLASGEIDAEAWDQVSNWLVWVLYAMVDQEGVTFEPAKLRKLMRGQVNEGQIQQALSKLQNSKDIEVDSKTKVARKTHAMMSDADKIPPELVRKIQSELIYLGLEALHKYGPKEREVSGFTMAMTEKEYEWVRFELRKLRKHIQKEILTNREMSPGERVYQVNIQLFPVTDKVVEEKSQESGEEKKSAEDLSKPICF
ncbi:MAG: TIGR02147 family protein [Bdellovibrionales bacterium]|nr:TIGR02147 family protein [Bdellovibrionales bacterium]